MLPGGPFTINHIHYTREELIAHGMQVLQDDRSGQWEKALFGFILDFLDFSKPLLQRTSGTTGNPKTFELNRESMIHSSRMTLAHFNIQPGDTALLCLPVEYIAGKMMVVRALAGGLNLITVKPSGNPFADILDSNDKPLKGEQGIFKNTINLAAMVPLQVYEAIKTPELLENKIGTLLIGGGEIAGPLRDKIAGLEKTRVYETFAMTETLTHFAARKINGPDRQSAFHTLKGVTIDTDTRGCLVVSVEGITTGRVTTNDVVEIQSPGTFQWLGRLDNVIKTGGIKIIPEQLEDRIRSITGLSEEIAIVGLPDEKLGSRLALVVESDKDKNFTAPILEQLKSTLPFHELPREIYHLPQFPRNASMKIDRNTLVQKLNNKLD